MCEGVSFGGLRVLRPSSLLVSTSLGFLLAALTTGLFKRLLGRRGGRVGAGDQILYISGVGGLLDK